LPLPGDPAPDMGVYDHENSIFPG